MKLVGIFLDDIHDPPEVSRKYVHLATAVEAHEGDVAECSRQSFGSKDFGCCQGEQGEGLS